MQEQTEQQDPLKTEIPESKKFLNQRAPKQYKINIQLISQTSIDQALTEKLSEQQRIEAVVELKSIHLQWLNIRRIQNLQVFTNLNVLYLQHNKIAKIQHLQCLKNLQYLALNNNLISRVEGLIELKKLAGLNLNNNQIEEIDARQLPTSLQLLSFKQNPVCLDSNYKIDIVKNLPFLQMLDDFAVSAEQRLKIIGKFPQHLLQYSQKMKQFRNKQKYKKQLEQQSTNKPLYLGGQIDESEALKEIRQKTRKFMHDAQQSFKADLKQQHQNFKSKIKVSKKIRNFKEQQIKKSKMTEIKESNQQNNEDH